MQVNIVAPDDWVCGWIADTLARKLECTHTQGIVEDSTNIYVPYLLLRKKTRRDIALFTHYALRESWDLATSLADICIAMSEKTAEMLPKEKTVILEIPTDPQFRKDKVIFGVCGREYVDNRKRTRWIEKLGRIPGVEIRFTGGQVAWEDMPRWYGEIDYLLVLSNNEGGPLPVKEAIAMGKPVIAPDVGWAWNYPVIRYTELDELQSIMRRLTSPSSRPDDWDIFAGKIRSLC